MIRNSEIQTPMGVVVMTALESALLEIERLSPPGDTEFQLEASRAVAKLLSSGILVKLQECLPQKTL